MLHLYAWSPALDLPSVDPQCMTIECYLRMLKIDFSIVECNDPNVSPTGELPLLKDGLTWISGTDRIIAHLAMKNQDANSDLTRKEKAEYLAYNSLIQDNLYDLLLFSWYFDTQNYIRSIRPTYAHLLPFPLRYIIPSQLRRAAKNRLSLRNLELHDTDPGDPKGGQPASERVLLESGWHPFYKLAREAYQALQERLCEPYFFGEKPTVIDAALYAHLYAIYNPTLENPRLSQILKDDFPKLKDYALRMHKEFMEHSATRAEGDGEKLASFWLNPTKWARMIWGEVRERVGADEENKKKKKTDAEKSFERKRLLAIVGGVIFMVAYVVVNGIIQIEFADKGEGDEDEDEEEEEVDPEALKNVLKVLDGVEFEEIGVEDEDDED